MRIIMHGTHIGILLMFGDSQCLATHLHLVLETMVSGSVSHFSAEWNQTVVSVSMLGTKPQFSSSEIL
jgi:hypothetical protein